MSLSSHEPYSPSNPTQPLFFFLFFFFSSLAVHPSSSSYVSIGIFFLVNALVVLVFDSFMGLNDVD